MVFSGVTRKQAFLTHLTVSVCVFFIFAYLIAFHWFPDFYFKLDGGIRAIVTIFVVDVVLGPGLTLLIFKPGKKWLKFDMAVILLFQLSALVWGVSNVYKDRSGTAVFYLGKIVCIAHSDTREMDMNAIAMGPSGRQRLSFLQRPDTIDEFLEFSKEAFSHQSSAIYYYGEKIVPLDNKVIKRLPNYKLNLTALAAENTLSAKKVGAYIGNHKKDMEHISLIPLSCRYGSAVAVYDRRELRITDLIEVNTRLSAEAQDEPLPLKLDLLDIIDLPGLLDYSM